MGKPVQEKRFEYKGFPCVVLFMPMGYRCGYVGVSKDNKYFKKDCMDTPIKCHGGLNYSSNHLYGQEDKDTWWVGFDCGHIYDGFDIKALNKYYPLDIDVQFNMKFMLDYYKSVNEYSEIKTIEYVEEECKKIVDQLLNEVEE